VRPDFAPWATCLATGVAATAVIMLLPASPAQDFGYVLVTLATPVAVVVGTRMHRPYAPLVW